jgi:hypothetical protein
MVHLQGPKKGGGSLLNGCGVMSGILQLKKTVEGSNSNCSLGATIRWV